MSKTSSTTPRISTFVLVIIFITLALSITALVLGVNTFTYGQRTVAGYLFLIGFLGIALSTYVLFQTRRRIAKLSIQTPPVTTTIECQKCGFKSIREYQRGDYVFKDVEPCQKCNDNMLITAIYKEIKEKGRRTF